MQPVYGLFHGWKGLSSHLSKVVLEGKGDFRFILVRKHLSSSKIVQIHIL
jgi:hypothetical protein